MNTHTKISVIVHGTNVEGSIRELYRRITTVLRQLELSWEIIYVDDASVDGSWSIVRELSEHDASLIGVLHSRPFGSQASYTTGLNYCTGDAAILLDGDIQDPPELFPELVKKWNEGNDVVYTVTTQSSGPFFLTLVRTSFSRCLNRITDVQIPINAGDYCLLSRRVIDTIRSFPERDRYIRGLRMWVGFPSTKIPYTRQDRYWGTHESFGWYVSFGKRLMISFSHGPLRWIAVLAAVVILLAAFLVVFYTILSFFFPPPKGFSTLFFSILFMSAVELLTVSVIAAYLGRMLEEVKKRPTAIISDVVGSTR